LKDGGSGMLALPGTYQVELSMIYNSEEKQLAGPVTFKTKVLDNRTLPARDEEAFAAFYDNVANLWRVMNDIQKYQKDLETKTAYVRQALQQSHDATMEMKNEATNINKELDDIAFLFNGTPAKASWEEVPPEQMPLSKRLSAILWASWQSTSAPTETQKMNYNVLSKAIPPVIEQLSDPNEKLNQLDEELDKLNAPYTPGRKPKF
jgi:uncharacterized phage infection (PIP) family protein YhgE